MTSTAPYPFHRQIEIISDDFNYDIRETYRRTKYTDHTGYVTTQISCRLGIYKYNHHIRSMISGPQGTRSAAANAAAYGLLLLLYQQQDQSHNHISETFYTFMCRAGVPPTFHPNSHKRFYKIIETLGMPTPSFHLTQHPQDSSLYHASVTSPWYRYPTNDGWSSCADDAMATARTSVIEKYKTKFATYFQDIQEYPEFYPHHDTLPSYETPETPAQLHEILNDDHINSCYTGLSVHMVDDNVTYIILACPTWHDNIITIWIDASMVQTLTEFFTDDTIIKYVFDFHQASEWFDTKDIEIKSLFDLKNLPTTPHHVHHSLTTMMANTRKKFYNRNDHLISSIRHIPKAIPFNEWSTAQRRAALLDAIACVDLATPYGNNPPCRSPFSFGDYYPHYF